MGEAAPPSGAPSGAGSQPSRPFGLGKTASFALLALLSIGIPRVAMQASASTLFLTYHSAATLAYIYLAVAALIPVVVSVFLAVEKRVATGKLLIGLEAARALMAVALYVGVTSPEASAFSFAAVVWVETEFVLASLVCWGLAGQLFAVSETKNAYPRISAGQQAGALLTGAAIPLLMRFTEPTDLLWVSAGSLLLSVLLLRRLAAGLEGGPKRRPSRVGAKGAPRPPPFNRLMRAYVAAIMAAALLANVAFYLIDNLFYRTVESRFADPQAMASFLGLTFSLSGAVTLTLSLFAAPKLLTRFGIGTATAWLPGALLLVGAAVIGTHLLGLSGTALAFAAVTALKLADEGFRVAFYRPAFQGLYQPIPAAGRVKAQARSEGLAEPAGIALAGLVVLALGTGDRTALLLAAIAVAGFAAWFGVARLIRRLHLDALGLAAARRQNIDMAGGGLDGPEARRLLVETLRSGDEAGRIAAADLLARSNRKLFLAAAPGLIRTGSERLVAPILDALDPAELAHLFPVLRDRLWREKQPGLRARILLAIGQLREPRVTAVLAAATYGQGGEREAAYAGMVRVDRGAAGEQAEAELRAMTAAGGPPSERRLFLGVLAQSGSSRFDAELARLFRDRDRRTRRMALSVAGQSGRTHFIGPLARCLEEPGGAAADAAASALASLGRAAVPRLAGMLDGSANRRVRELAALALGRVGSTEAREALARHVFHSDFDTASAAALALARCGGRLGAGAARQTFEHVEGLLGSAAELRQAAADVGELPQAELLPTALNQRAGRFTAHALVLAALQRKGGGVDIGPLVSSRLRSEQKLYVAELVDGLMPPRLRPLCAALTGGVEPGAELRLFHARGLARPRTSAQRLAWLISAPSGGEWLRACALHAASLAGGDARGALLRAAGKEAGLVGETARRLLQDGVAEGNAMGLSTIEKVLILKKSDLFGSIPDDYLAAFAPMMESTYFAPGETVMREGERGDRLFTVVSGRLEISRGQSPVATAGANDLIGDLAALDPQPVGETAVALTECHLLELTNDHLETLISSHPDISFGIIKVLCRRLQRAQTAARGEGEDVQP